MNSKLIGGGGEEEVCGVPKRCFLFISKLNRNYVAVTPSQAIDWLRLRIIIVHQVEQYFHIKSNTFSHFAKTSILIWWERKTEKYMPLCFFIVGRNASCEKGNKRIQYVIKVDYCIVQYLINWIEIYTHFMALYI